MVEPACYKEPLSLFFWEQLCMTLQRRFIFRYLHSKELNYCNFEYEYKEINLAFTFVYDDVSFYLIISICIIEQQLCRLFVHKCLTYSLLIKYSLRDTVYILNVQT